MLMKATCPSSIAVGDILRHRRPRARDDEAVEEQDRVYIVLKTGRGSGWTHLIDIELGVPERYHKAVPFKLRTGEVLQRLSHNVEDELALEFVPNFVPSVAESRRPAGHEPHRRSQQSINAVENPTLNRGWMLIEQLLTFDIPYLNESEKPQASTSGDQFEELLHKETRAKRIQRFLETHKYSESTVYRTLRRWLQRGLTPAAAGDDYHRSGGKGKHKNFSKHTGRKPRGRSLRGSPVDDEIRRLLQLAADWVFTPEFRKGKRAKKSMPQAVRWLKVKLAKRRVYDERGLLTQIEFDPARTITTRQLQYYIAQTYSYRDRRVRQVGIKQYLLHERPLTGRLSDTRGPGERYHIDASVIDIYPVARHMRTVALPRLTVYFVVDDWSRMIVGLYIAFEPPCWNGAMAALVNAVSPKVDFCRKLGIAITEEDWPCSRLPETLYADQGEVSSVHKATPLTVHYRVEISNAPAYRPDLRSVMETRFKSVPQSWMPFVPGAVEKVAFERGERHPALDAALDINEIREIVVRAVLDYDTRSVTGYPTPPEMVERGLAPTPLNLWVYGTETNGFGRSVNVAEFRARVMTPGKATIVANGINFGGVIYDNPLSLVERQSMKRAEGKDTELTIDFDGVDNTEIRILGLGEPVPCGLAESVPAWLHGLSHYEVQKYKELNSTNVNNSYADQEESRAMAEHNIQKLASDGARETRRELNEKGMAHVDITRLGEPRDDESMRDDALAAREELARGNAINEAKSPSSQPQNATKSNRKRRSPSKKLEQFLANQRARQVEDSGDIFEDEEEPSKKFMSISDEAEARARDLFASL
ncbi:integrase [Caballeronia sp. J97]|uniref:integrase n=1 Tax=Caballeronia sp. J97 TaxID=2805429 RepID=UPI002AAFF537|nr:integrase [Caballeronia sp. J97]